MNPNHRLATAPRRHGRRGRVEVWYATATDPATGAGLWVHGEVVSPITAPAYAHGWLALFPVDGVPAVARFGPADVPPDADAEATPESEPESGSESEPASEPQSGSPWFRAGPDVVIGPDGTRGRAAGLAWDLAWRGDGDPLWTFPRWAWQRDLLPAAQVVAEPATSVAGWVSSGEVEQRFDGVGALAHIYGHGNAERWAWLHADLGDGAVLEIVTAVSRRAPLNRLAPLAFVQLRLPGERDWPRDPALAAPLFRSRVDLPRWTVSGIVGRRRLRVEVVQPPERCDSLRYTDPDEATATCTNSERADATVTLERWAGRWQQEHRWTLAGTAHAEVGTRP